MNERLPQRSSPLESQIVEILVERIQSGAYPVNSRLPSESELAAEFAVSRTTVRGALGTLASNGLVKRRHGVGTFISPATRISNPLNEVINFAELVTGQGYAFGFRHIGARFRPAEPRVSEALGLAAGAEILEVSKAFTADGAPVIYTVNLIPPHLFEQCYSRQDMLQPGATEPLYEFLEGACGQRIEQYVATVRPSIARNILIHDQPPEGDPLLPVLVIEEVAYNGSGVPVLYEIEYLLGDRMKFDLVRRRRFSNR
jgi:GntR family transcriptional regulator